MKIQVVKAKELLDTAYKALERDLKSFNPGTFLLPLFGATALKWMSTAQYQD